MVLPAAIRAVWPGCLGDSDPSDSAELASYNGRHAAKWAPMSVTIERGDAVVHLANAAVAVEVATGFGPRLTSFRRVDGRNVLASLPDASLEWRPGRPYRLRGGHRLWIAPEVRDKTYVPDDAPVDVAEADGAVTVARAASADTPFSKSIEVQLEPVTSEVTVTHRVHNEGRQPVVVAPWAITMLRPDGTVLLPLREGEPDGLQGDRNIVVWPYTRIRDPGIEIDDEAIVVRPNRQEPTKIGTSGQVGWGAYVVDGTVFMKSADFDPAANYPDRGASLQCYARDTFCELETLGPLTSLAPGEVATHIERWSLQPFDDLAADSLVAGLLRHAGLT